MSARHRIRPHGRHRAHHRGAVTVEFALVFPMVVVLIAGALVFGLYAFWSALGDYAARSTARYASIKEADGYPDNAEVGAHAGNVFSGVLGSPSAISQTNNPAVAPSAYGQGDLVKVTVTYRVPGVSAMSGLFGALSGGTIDLDFLETVTHSASARRE